ncbi:MAG: serine hydrolase domain-containing protein [Roseiflexaceae bacterium]
MSALNDALLTRMHEAIALGHEEGLQLAVYHHGQLVVDLTVGAKDDAGTPLQPDDLVLVWSTSKGITATAIHILAERNQIAYDDAIADYWPEFASHGKEAISIRHLMSHTAGIYALPSGYSYEVMRDYAAICAIIADLVPAHQPGQSHIYHPLTYGWPLAKVVEAVTGISFGEFIQREICAPLGISDLFIGVPHARLNDVARLSHDATPEQLANPENPLPDPTVMANDPAILATCIPAANMVASARAVAKVYASLLDDGINGVRLLSPKQTANATRIQFWGQNIEESTEIGHSLGFALGRANPLYGSHHTAFGHCGYGGATGFADPTNHLAFALTKTRMTLAPDRPSIKHDLAAIVRVHLCRTE